ncbi:hypothetical protein GN244_ATG18257 [Phytophthora infestans]|uniref:Uncharacterized protein n=1 Tax=Phytophthora infestans TaxID=4787 RepID=A0A833W603_PHYIN|nr:hypothetical protein GN244_ATG18257 [Phytophthora infestans]
MACEINVRGEVIRRGEGRHHHSRDPGSSKRSSTAVSGSRRCCQGQGAKESCHQLVIRSVTSCVNVTFSATRKLRNTWLAASQLLLLVRRA